MMNPVSRRSALRARREREVTSNPPTRIVPLSGRVSAQIMRASVVFPEPLRPMIATVSPRETLKDRSLITVAPPYP